MEKNVCINCKKIGFGCNIIDFFCFVCIQQQKQELEQKQKQKLEQKLEQK